MPCPVSQLPVANPDQRTKDGRKGISQKPQQPECHLESRQEAFAPSCIIEQLLGFSEAVGEDYISCHASVEM